MKHLHLLLLFAALCLPWTMRAQVLLNEDFEGSACPPSGWTMIYANASHPSDNDMSLSTTYSHSGSQSFRFSSYSSGTPYDQYLITPALNLSPNRLVSFYWHRHSSGSETFSVGYSTTDSLPASFTWRDTIVAATGSDWNLYDMVIPSNARYVAIHYFSNYAYYLYIDDFSVENLSCMFPSNLTTSDMQPDGLTVSWTPGGSESQWQLSIDPASPNGSVFYSSSTSFAFNNLQPSTPYLVSCRAICGPGDTSYAVSSSFTTPCVPISASDLPYTEDFESYGASPSSPISPCWYKATNGSDYPYPSSTAISGNRSLYFYGYSPTPGTSNTPIYSYAVLPQVDAFLGVNNLQLAFDVMRSSSSGNTERPCVIVGIMSDPTDLSTFDTVQVIDLSSQAPSSVLNVEILFHGYRGSGSYVAILCPVPVSSGAPYSYNKFYVDNVSLETLPSCVPPLNLVVSDVQANSVSLSWQHGDHESAWIVSDGINEYVSVDTFYTFSGLSPNTYMTFSVRALCGAGDTSKTVSTSVRTLCGLMASLPFVEDFEHQPVGSNANDSDFIPCWGHLNNGLSKAGYPYVIANIATATYNHTQGGTRALYWYNKSSGSDYGDYQAIVFPPIDTTVIAMNQLNLKFWTKTTKATYHPVLYVGVMANPDSISSFQPVDSINVEGTSYYEVEASFANFQGFGSNVAIVGYRSSGTWYAYVDDISLERLAACPHVDSLDYAFSPDGVQVSWTEMGNATAWELVAATSSNPALINQDDVVIATQPFYTFSNLVNGTTYYFFVRPVCSEPVEWFGPLAVTPGSICMPVSGSESVTGCGLVVFDNGGASGDYSISCNAYLTVYPESPDSLISFYGSYNTESPSWDWLTVYEGVGNTGNVLFDQRAVGSSVGAIDTTTSLSGPITIWFRSDGSTNAPGFVLHTFCSPAPNCGDVVDVSVQAGPSSALVSWTPGVIGDYAGANVEYRQADDASADWIALPPTSQTFVGISDLSPTTLYDLRVQSVCDEGDGGWYQTQFATSAFLCLSLDSTSLFLDTMGHDYYPDDYFPSNSLYNYSLTQQIYLASEFDTAALGGAITKFAFQLGDMDVNRIWNIYVSTTSQSNLISSFIPIASTDLVWSGNTVSLLSNAWNEITLPSPITLDGSNILITFQDLTGTWASGNEGIMSDYSSEAISRYDYRDASPYDPTSAISSGTPYSNRLNVFFFGGECLRQQTCVAPILRTDASDVDQVSLNWVPGNTESSWNVYFRAATDSAFTLDGSTSSPSYVFSGLLPSSHYVFKVASLCDGVEGGSAVADCWTLCGPMPVPFVENFDNEPTGTFSRPCWLSGTTALGTLSPYPTVSTLDGNTNQLCLLHNGAYLVLPKMDAQLNALQARFSLVQNDSNVRLMVGLLDNIDDPISSITPIDTIVRSHIDPFNASVIVAVPFDRLPDSANGHIVFFDAWNDGYSYIDNLNIEYIPMCSSISDISVSNITSSSADVSWAESCPAASSYIVEYGPHHFPLGSGSQISTTAPFVTLSGLNTGTSYDLYVYTVCSSTNDTSLASNVAIFATACGPVSLPYFENFENVLEPGSSAKLLPNCWNYAMTVTGRYAGANYVPTVFYAANDDQASSGSYCLRLYGESLTVLPEMPTSVGNLMLSFHDYTSSPTVYRLVVGAVDSVSPGFEASFVALDTIVANGNQCFFLNNYTGNGRFIAFHNIYNNQTSDFSYHYIDDISVDYVPSCIFPMNFSTTAVSSSTIDIAWTTSNAPNYEYEYGVSGFSRGSGITGYCSGQAASLSGLSAGTSYDFYVRGICGAGDTSDWAMYAFRTRNADPAPLPFFCDFSDSSLVNAGFEVVNNATNAWTVGPAAGNPANSLYISSDGGLINAYANSVTTMSYAYRDIILPDGEFSYSYDWMANGESTWDYLRVWLTPASEIFTANKLPDGTTSTNSYVSSTPEGWIPLDGGSKLNLSTSWANANGVFDAQAGTYHLVFMWCNDGSGGTNPPAAIDNISIVQNLCPAPTNVHASAAGISSIEVDWSDRVNPLGWQLAYGTDMNNLTFIDVSSHPVLISNLDSLTNYFVRVRPICSDADTGRWSETALLGTTICDHASIASTGTPSSTSYFAPVNTFFNFSLSETIIDSAELSGPQSISAISYFYDYSSSVSNKGNVDIYLQPTDKSVFASAADMVALDTSIAVKVFSGAFNCSQGWNIFLFDNAYEYDGASNLLVIVDDNSGAYHSSSFVFGTAPCSGNKTIAYYSDSSNPDVFAPSSFSDSKSVYSWRPAMRLISCGECPDPAIASVSHSPLDITLNWIADNDSCEVAIAQGPWVDPVVTTQVVGSSFTFTNLDPATTYNVGVRQRCDVSDVSDWAVVEITTDSLPCFAPDSLQMTNATYYSVSITWIPGGQELQWQVRLFNSTFDSTYTATATTSFTATDLQPGITYSAAVRSLCGDATNLLPGDWSDTITVTTADCQPVSNVRVTNVTASAATITWTAGGSENAWVIEYSDMPDFAAGTGTIVNATSNPFDLPLVGFEPETEYYFYVYAQCDASLRSVASDRASFTTQNVGIDDVDASRSVSIYPNPATHAATLTLGGVDGQLHIDIVDMNGRKVQSLVATADGGLTTTLDISTLAQGAYFVRIYGDNFSSVKKLVVR